MLALVLTEGSREPSLLLRDGDERGGTATELLLTDYAKGEACELNWTELN